MILAAILIQSRGATTGPPDEPIVAASTAPDEPSPTPTPSPSPSDEPIAIPTPDTTGRDFDRIFREINAFRDWLFQNPDQADSLSVIYHVDCDCFQRAEETLAELESRGWHFDGGGFEILDIEVVEDFPSVVRLRVRVDLAAHRILDSDGHLVETVRGEGEARFSIALVRITGRWLVRTVTQVG